MPVLTEMFSASTSVRVAADFLMPITAYRRLQLSTVTVEVLGIVQ